MNKSEAREIANLDVMARMLVMVSDAKMRDISIGYLARSYSALARASRKSRNEIITAAMAVPAIVQHPDFVV